MAKVFHYPPNLYAIDCPACGYEHPFDITRWTWNGDLEKPTFQPSMLVFKDDPSKRCHSFVTDGKIQFLADSWHGRSDTVDLPDVDDD